MPLPLNLPFTMRKAAIEPHQVLKSSFHALFPVHVPSPPANVPSSHQVRCQRKLAPNCHGRLEGYYELGHKWRPAPAGSPKKCPCAKTLCMAKDCHKT
eukprot:987555-Amphidinium_carterae.1